MSVGPGRLQRHLRRHHGGQRQLRRLRHRLWTYARLRQRQLQLPGGVCRVRCGLHRHRQRRGQLRRLRGCSPGQLCTGGLCQCLPGPTDCSASCVDAQSDASHCRRARARASRRRSPLIPSSTGALPFAVLVLEAGVGSQWGLLRKLSRNVTLPMPHRRLDPNPPEHRATTPHLLREAPAGAASRGASTRPLSA